MISGQGINISPCWAAHEGIFQSSLLWWTFQNK